MAGRSFRCVVSVLASVAMLAAPIIAFTRPAMAGPLDADPLIPADEYTPFSKTHHNDDGTSTAQVFTVPAFTQASGTWERVDTTLVASDSPTATIAYDVPGAFRPVHFGRTAADLIKIDTGPSVLTLAPSGLTVGEPSLDGAGVLTYSDVARDTDLTVAMSGAGVRTKLRLNSALSPLVYHWQLSDPGHALGPVAAVPGGGFAFDAIFEGGVRIGLEPAFAYPVDLAHPEYVPGSQPGSATLAVVQTPTGYDITEAVNPAWLLGKSFPIVLDPNLTFFTNDPNGGMDTHIVDGTVANYNYGYTSVFELGYGSGTDTSGSFRRALNRFNLTSVPSNAVITDGRAMNFLVNNYQCCPPSGPWTINVDAYEVGESWDHNWATWNKRDQYNAWSSQHGGFIGSPIANHLIGYDPGSATTCGAGLLCQWPMTSTVQRWVNGQLANNGILFKLQTESTRQAVMAMASGEYSQSQYWPYLQLTYATPPTPPNNVYGTGGDGYITVNWTPPSSDGGSPINGYTARAYLAGTNTEQGNAGFACGGCSSTSVTGLVNGTSYDIRAFASNAAGTSQPGYGAPVTPARRPYAPSGVNAVAGNTTATVSWQAPNNGGSGITGYGIIIHDRTQGTFTNAPSVCASCTITTVPGLINGDSYSFIVSANNSVGSGDSTESNTVVPSGPPSAPAPTAAVGDGTVTISWSKPNENGSPILSYTVKASDTTTGSNLTPDRTVVPPAALSTSYSGLTNGHIYRFTVTATNANGSATSADLLAKPHSFPGTPTGLGFTVTGTTATLTWGAPLSDGGEPIDRYDITGHDDTANASLTPHTCTDSPSAPCRSNQYTGIFNGHNYTFTVSAHNSLGNGQPASTSQPAPVLQPVLTKTVSPAGPVSAGTVVTYTVTIANHNNTTLYSTLTDGAPAGVTLLTRSLSVDGTLCPAGACTFTTSSLSIKDIAVPANDVRTITYTGQVLGNTRTCSAVSNIASAVSRSGPGLTGIAAPNAQAPPVNVSSCEAGLGRERWWSYLSRQVGPESLAAVNVANGNLVVQANDATPVQAHGHLTFGLRRTYNSQALPSVLLPGSLGAGWQFNFGEVAGEDMGALGSALLVPTVPGLLDAALDPLAVVLVDRDGTRHTFRPNLGSARVATLAVPNAGSSLGLLAGTPQAALAPVALSAPAGSQLCVDLTYQAPAGVHLSMWRYLATNEANCTATANGSHPIVGYATMRPDRLRSEYDANGRLLDVRDASGSALRYAYGTDPLAPGFNRLVAVYEPASCTLTQVNATSSTCRAFRLAYTSNVPNDTAQLQITDPAGRLTTYDLDHALTTSNNPHLTKVTNPDGSTVNYTYGGCGGTGDQLCAISDPRHNNTTFTYTASGLPAAGSPPAVATVTDRRQTTTAISYPSSALTVVDTGPANSSAGHRQTYTGIDAQGRVGQLDEADSAGAVLRRTQYTWDSTATGGTTCRQPDNTADNNLCSQLQAALGDAAGDEQTSYLYNPEGQLIRERQHLTTGTLDTTYGYRAQYVPASGTTITYNDTIAGNGTVTSQPSSGARGTPNTLFVVSDRTETLTPRGNAAGGSFTQFRTTYLVDNDPTQPINTAPATGTCLAADGSPTATGNTGLLCETDGPAFDSSGTPTRNVYGYDSSGAKTVMFTAKALADAGRTAAGSSAAGVARYSYAYYPDTANDLSGTTSAGGWLRAISDPKSPPTDPFGADGHYVTFGYDAAGNAARSWDRDATAGHTLSEYPGTVAAPGPGPVAESLRPATNDNAISATQALAAPWRYIRISTDPAGNTTRTQFDPNGNRTTVTPPRGTTGAGNSNYDTTYAYTADDLPSSVRGPLDAASATTLRYDQYGNQTSVTVADAPGETPAGRHTTVYRYDALNRRIATLTSRGPGTAATGAGQPDGTDNGPGCWAARAGDSPLLNGRIYCESTTAYDHLDNIVGTVDANRQTSTDSYDAAHRHLTHRAPRTVNAAPGLRTQMLYDPDGHVTDVCSPRQFSEGDGTCTTTSVYATHNSYDPAGRISRTIRYRDASHPLTSTTRYDADGNPIATVDPRGLLETGDHTTDMTYNALDRLVTTDVPRAGITTRQYTPAGDLAATLEPGSQAGPGTGDNPDGSTNAARALRITGYTYDADHRVIDTVTALQVTGADPASDPATVAAATTSARTDQAAQTNLRSRVHYDADGHIDQQFSPQAFVHPDGDPTGVSDPTRPDRRYLTTTNYDAAGRSSRRVQPRADTADPLTSDPTADPTQNSECAVGAPGYPGTVQTCTTDYGYDNAGNLTTVGLPTRTSSTTAARTLTFNYTDDNLLQDVTGPNPAHAPGSGEPASITLRSVRYDGPGRTVADTNAAGHTTTSTYSADGLLTQTAGNPGPNGLTHIINYGYDQNGQQTYIGIPRTVTATGGTTSSETDTTETRYNADGTIAAVTTGGSTTASGSTAGTITTSYGYDGNANPVTVTSPSANAADSTNPGRVPTTNTYTEDNLLATSTVPVSTSGTIQTRITSYSYDPAGRKTQTAVALSTPAGTSTDQAFSYYPNGLLRSQTGRATPAGRASITTSYDATGQQTSTTDTEPDGTSRTNTASYYLDGLLRQASDTTATTSYGYDGAGALTSRAHTPATGTGTTTRYTPNDAGLPLTITGGVEGTNATSTWTWTRLGRPSFAVRANGLVQYWFYGSDNLLTNTHTTNASGSTTLSSDSYTYDEPGRILSQAFYGQNAAGTTPSTIPSATPVTYQYSYDPAGRLASFTDPAGTRTLTFDHDGNRTAYGTTGQTQAASYTYRADDSIASSDLSVPGTGGLPATPQHRTYTYAPFGGITNDGCSNYTHDGFDRLARITHDTASTAIGCPTGTTTYSYDGSDRQTQSAQTSGAINTTTNYSYDGWTNQVLDEATTGTTNSALRYELSSTGKPLVAKIGSKLEYLADDGTGSINLVTDNTDSVQCTVRYDPYGNPDGNTPLTPSSTCNSGSTDTDIYYRTDRRDPSTGNYQFGSRTYDPTKASFLTPDSYRTAGSGANAAAGVDPLTRNTYSYVNGDPINATDPSGHRVCTDSEASTGQCVEPWNDNARGWAEASHRASVAGKRHLQAHQAARDAYMYGPLGQEAAQNPAAWCYKHSIGDTNYCALAENFTAAVDAGVNSLAGRIVGLPALAACADGSRSDCVWFAGSFVPFGKVRLLREAAEGSGGLIGGLRSLNWADDTGAIGIARDRFGFPDVQALRGADAESVLDAIPDNWLVESPSSGSGIKFVNPDRPGQMIIYEEGWAGATDPLHAGPYLRVSTGRGPVFRVPLYGNPALGGQP